MTDQAQPKKPKRPRDANQLARRIVDIATGDTDDTAPSPPIDPKKDAAAVALGRKGGLKGGKARAEKLSPEERKRIAAKAASARWESRTKK